MWNPKMLVKLVTTTEIQELELTTDANTVNPLFSPPSPISPPPLFRGGKLISPPLPLPQSLFFTKKLTINVD